MRRAEFSKETKRKALARSRGRCEARGAAYGFARGHRCDAALAFGVEFDHYPIRASDGGPNDLSNCVATCIRCHRWKPHKIDVPRIAKAKRIQDKTFNIRDRATPFPGSRASSLKRTISGRAALR
jgi:hypothetical protein